MKTCDRCGRPSDYSTCTLCESIERERREDIEREEQAQDERLEQLRENAERIAEASVNPGDYPCPECLYRTLKRGASRCPTCHANVGDEYWSPIYDRERAAHEKWKSEAPARARAAAAARRKELSQAIGKFIVRVCLIPGILIWLIWFNGCNKVMSIFHDEKPNTGLAQPNTSLPGTESETPPPPPSAEQTQQPGVPGQEEALPPPPSAEQTQQPGVPGQIAALPPPPSLVRAQSFISQWDAVNGSVQVSKALWWNKANVIVQSAILECAQYAANGDLLTQNQITLNGPVQPQGTRYFGPFPMGPMAPNLAKVNCSIVAVTQGSE